jgi:hypothetical protein
LKRASLLVLLVSGVFLLASASSAFAAYTQTFSVPSQMTPGTTLDINPTFTKDPTDPVAANTWLKVTIHNASAGDVVGTTGNWTNVDLATPGNNPMVVDTVNHTIEFDSYPNFTWSPNTIAVTGLGLKFVNPGNYTVDVALAHDTTGWPPGDPIVGTVKTYNVKVANTIVSTPASSWWSLGLACVLALGWVFRPAKRAA